MYSLRFEIAGPRPYLTGGTSRKSGISAHQARAGRHSMAITLNHTIVPARDKEAAARFFARIFGLKYDGPMSHFAPVRVNGDLTLDFDNADSFEVHHYAFH